MAEVQGYCEERFSKLRTLLQANIDAGIELGASLAVEIDGKLVIDLWGGYLDKSKTTLWQKDTVVNLYSTTKNISSLAALLLVERGLLNLDERVSKYWPEFGTNGKEEIIVRQIMSHTSGIPTWEKPVTLDEVLDIRKANSRLAQQRPWWKPGTVSGYHSMTHGHLISELVYRITGQSLREFVAGELSQPLKADFQLGLASKDYSRVATIVAPVPAARPSTPPLAPAPGSVMERAMGAPPITPEMANTDEWRRAEVGAGNGHSNGRSVARILSPLVLSGTSSPSALLSSATIDHIFEEQSYGEDLVVGQRLRFGTGFGLPAKDTYWNWTPASGRICGWGGWGGSMGIADVGRRMTIGYAMNQMHDVGMGSVCTKAYVAEIYKSLGVEI